LDLQDVVIEHLGAVTGWFTHDATKDAENAILDKATHLRCGQSARSRYNQCLAGMEPLLLDLPWPGLVGNQIRYRVANAQNDAVFLVPSCSVVGLPARGTACFP
jgi:hypothetical protein